MQQAILREPQKVEFRQVPKPSPRVGQVLLQVKRIGVCGSDIHAYYGKHPYISCPIVQGHEFSGEVAAIGSGVRGIKTGDRVTVRPQLTCGSCYPCTHGNYHICNELKVIGCQAEGAAQEFIAVPQGLVFKLPAKLDYDSGAMVEPVAVGVHAVGRLGSVEGKKVLVLGAGPIGNLTAQAARGLGAQAVMLTDVNDFRLSIARECGIEGKANPAREDLAAAVKTFFGPDGADAILECVGVKKTVEQAISLARKGTDIVIVGVFGKKPTVDIGLVQDKELRLIGTLMYKAEDYRTAIELIRAGRVNLKSLMTTHFAFKDYGKAYKYIEENRDRTMKVFIDL
jgi:L-iditol 2-dehydrogenase